MSRIPSRISSREKTLDHTVPVPPALVKTEPAGLRWGVVATLKAPLIDIAGFAAYHLSLGADQVFLYLDDPQERDITYLKDNDKIDITACDTAWWARQRRPRNAAHQRRQMYNATHAYQRCSLDWLAHIDVDEFILPTSPIREALARVPAQDAALQMPSAELLAPLQPADLPRYFKLTPRQGGQPSHVREDIYPTYGSHLRGGFISHIDGKLFVRTGLENVTIGIHSLLFQGLAAQNQHRQSALRLGHAHAPSWEIFERHLDFRLAKGSYRKRDTGRKRDAHDFRLHDIIDYLRETEGTPGLRHLFEEVNAATPTLLQALRTHNMLVEHPLDLNRKIIDIFGKLPPEQGQHNEQ